MRYESIRKAAAEHCGVELTEAQVVQFVEESGCSFLLVGSGVSAPQGEHIVDRTVLASILVDDILGPNIHWPLYDDTPEYVTAFLHYFVGAAPKKGYPLVPGWWPCAECSEPVEQWQRHKAFRDSCTTRDSWVCSTCKGRAVCTSRWLE